MNLLEAFRKLLGLPHVEAEDMMSVAKAIGWYECGLDFADALHLASSRSEDEFATFDSDLVKRAKALGLAIKAV